MNLLRSIIFLQFATTLTFGQSGHQSKPRNVPEQPAAMVRNFYKEVAARHPLGIPKDADMKVFAPYLSKPLIRRIDTALACERDYYRRNINPGQKPEIEWLEFGLFTGGNEKVSPGTFQVEKTRSEKDGSFQVYVRFTWRPTDPWTWQTAAIVVQENGHFVVDDIIFLKDEFTREDEYRLSETLAMGCDGPRWVGYGKRQGG